MLQNSMPTPIDIKGYKRKTRILPIKKNVETIFVDKHKQFFNYTRVFLIFLSNIAELERPKQIDFAVFLYYVFNILE